MKAAGSTVLGAAVAGGGVFAASAPASAAGVFTTPKPDPYMGMPKSFVLSLPSTNGQAPLPPLPDQLAEGICSPDRYQTLLRPHRAPRRR
jgi:hypothetical protein